MSESTEDATPADFITNIKRARDARGLTQAELAEKLVAEGIVGMNQSNVSRIEKGERDVRLVEAQAMAKVFGVSLDILTGPPGGLEDALDWIKLMALINGSVTGVLLMSRNHEIFRHNIQEYLRDPKVPLDPRVARQYAALAKISAETIARESMRQVMQDPHGAVDTTVFLGKDPDELRAYQAEQRGRFTIEAVRPFEETDLVEVDVVTETGERRTLTLPGGALVTVDRQSEGSTDGEHQEAL